MSDSIRQCEICKKGKHDCAVICDNCFNKNKGSDTIIASVSKALFLPLIVMLFFSYGLGFMVTKDLVFYKEQVYTSWEQQQDYSEMLRQEINSKNQIISDLNTELQITKVVLIYQKDKCLK